jgi:hypothetical protein
MTEVALLKSWDLTVGLDQGQFYLQTEDPYGRPEVHVPQLVDRAISRGGIAQAYGQLVVLSPHQNNFAMGLRVELWDDRPPDDLSQWQEVFEVTLKVGRDGLIYDSPTLASFRIPVPPGLYQGLICGQGFSEHGWPGSTTPGDHWRIQLWPCTDELDCRRVKSWRDDVEDLRSSSAG